MANLEAYFLKGAFSVINFYDTVKTTIGLGPMVSLKLQKPTNRERLLLSAIQSENWTQVERVLAELNSSEVCLLVDNVTTKLKLTASIESWAEHAPNNYWAQLLFAYRLIHKAWRARGSGVSSTVSQRMYEKFYAYLSTANELLHSAIQLDPDRAEPYAALIVVEMGAGFDNEALWQNFIQLNKRDKGHYVGHTNMVHALCEKWGGSHEEMFSVARTGAKNNQDDSLLYGLIPMAHIERWLYFSFVDAEHEATEYFFRDDVTKELNQAFDDFMDRKETKKQIAYYDALNKFAFCFYLAGDDKAELLMKQVGYNLTDYPWSYQEFPFLSAFDAGHSFSQSLKYLGIRKTQLAKRL